jgi:hypothetical protein
LITIKEILGDVWEMFVTKNINTNKRKKKSCNKNNNLKKKNNKYILYI